MRKIFRTRWLVIVALMVLSMTMLVLPSNPTAKAQSSRACLDCAIECTNNAWWQKDQCLMTGGTPDGCHQQYRQYLNSCNAVFCNYGLGCELPTNY
jgi:hypothetical protein